MTIYTEPGPKGITEWVTTDDPTMVDSADGTWIQEPLANLVVIG